MKRLNSYDINIHGQLMSLERPRIMGILNLTPDSFFAESRAQSEREIATRTMQIMAEGGDIIDVGGCSTRPGAPSITSQEEMARLRHGLEIIRRIVPEAILSVDTYRADVATMCVEEYGVAIINDISAGLLDKRMFDTIARLNVPYVLTHMQGTPENMQQAPHYENLIQELLVFLAGKVNHLHQLGVKDVIIDPGFGFGKSIDHNYQLMAHLDQLHLLEHPLLVGVSRKSMVYHLIGAPPEEALNGTTALHMAALMQGAHILRVHDVRACHECIQIWEKLQSAGLGKSLTENNLIQFSNHS